MAKKKSKTCFSGHGEHFLNDILGQFNSTSVNVSVDASTAIALLFEASRRHKIITSSSSVRRRRVSNTASNLAGVIAADIKGQCTNNAFASV